MMRSLALPLILGAALFGAGCASAPAPPGVQVDQQRINSAVIVGQSTRDSVRAALGSTKSVVFDSGYQTWLYQVPRAGGKPAEFVILFDPAGVVRKTRTREPFATDLR